MAKTYGQRGVMASIISGWRKLAKIIAGINNGKAANEEAENQLIHQSKTAMKMKNNIERITRVARTSLRTPAARTPLQRTASCKQRLPPLPRMRASSAYQRSAPRVAAARAAARGAPRQMDVRQNQ